MPQQRRGESKQDYQTPEVFLDAVKRKLGIFAFGLDIAATARNAVAKTYFSPRDDAFAQPSWKATRGVWSWLNPPFGDIASWARRCADEVERHDANIAMLVPASVGSNWWAVCVHPACRNGLACALFLNGRITFVGQTDPYPKDTALVLWGRRASSKLFRGDYEIWRWPQR